VSFAVKVCPPDGGGVLLPKLLKRLSVWSPASSGFGTARSKGSDEHEPRVKKKWIHPSRKLDALRSGIVCLGMRAVVFGSGSFISFVHRKVDDVLVRTIAHPFDEKRTLRVGFANRGFLTPLRPKPVTPPCMGALILLIGYRPFRDSFPVSGSALRGSK
jgi:hypothetical protein